MLTLRTFTALALTLSLMGCSPNLTVFDRQLREQNDWTEEELSRIQFYLSQDLILTRERKSGSTAIVQGEVRLKDGRNIEELVFERGTPGVVLFQTPEGNLGIGFDAKRDDRFLMFGPNPGRGGDYTLLGKNAGRYQSTVTYADREWDVSNASAGVRLLLNLKRSGTTKRQTESVGGRRL